MIESNLIKSTKLFENLTLSSEQEKTFDTDIQYYH